MREVARWQSWPKEGESETENHESAELQSDQIKEMSKTSKAAKRQSAIKSLYSWLSHGSWSGFAAGAPCGYGSRKVLLGSRLLVAEFTNYIGEIVYMYRRAILTSYT
jgi:hypothetical protein